MRFYTLILSFCFIVSCAPKDERSVSVDVYATLPSDFADVLKAHGGLEKWRNFKTLEYDLMHQEDSIPSEHYVLDLLNRKDLTTADSFKIGYDGKEVWVAPEKKAFKGRSARFYHNLYSYFLTIPFIVADPGVLYKSDTLTLDSKRYNVISVNFEEGVGDADDDSYKMLVNPETSRMEKLLYTVTYYTGEAHENYNLLSYEDFESVEGLMLPTKLVGYKYNNGQIGDKRYEVKFKNITLKTESPDQDIFEMPSGAEIDSLKNN